MKYGHFIEKRIQKSDILQIFKNVHIILMSTFVNKMMFERQLISVHEPVIYKAAK